jgi:5-methylcytosine-specific restriction endonuclease McrA
MKINNADLGPQEIPEWRLKIYGGPLGGASRRYPTKRMKEALIEKQHNRCLYCDHAIGTAIERRGKAVILRPQYDHFVPYAYSRRNPRDNWVLACHVCNGIKSCRMFSTVADAQRLIRDERARKGYVVHELDLEDSHVR